MIIRRNKKQFLVLTAIFLSAVFLSSSPTRFALGAEVQIDASVHVTLTSHNGSSPTVVFTSDQVGYAFYRDSTGVCAYNKTTNGGDAWGAAVTVDVQTDCFKIAVWYDRWTPGDSTGAFIHIVTMDAADLWYTRLDTGSDTLTTTVNASGANQGGGFAVGANIPSITKGTDGDLYMGVQDVADSFVVKCASGADCAQIANWTEAGTNPLDLATDWLILMPLSGGNILAIRWDISADDVQSKVYNDAANSWDVSWATIDANAIEDGTYDAHFGATISKSTGDIYLAYAADVVTFGTDDDIRTAMYSGGAWVSGADVLTNDAKGITGVKISFDENTNEIYAVYTARTTPGTAATGNVYWKKSTDGMASWGAEQGPVNVVAGDLYGARINAMSDERIYASWDLASADDLLGNTIANLASADVTAPAAISNLALSAPSDSAMTASWTAPGDDGSTGTATGYDLRYSTSAITSGNFSSATVVAGEPVPQAAGTPQSMTVMGLSPSTTYFFAIKTSDEVPNTSAISNVPSLATLASGEAPAPPSPAGTAPAYTGATFSGWAYPQGTVEVIWRDRLSPLSQNGVASSSVALNGSFSVGIENINYGEFLFALRARDKRDNDSGIIGLDLNPFFGKNTFLDIQNLLVPPTIGFEEAVVSLGKEMKVEGYAAPERKIEMEVDGILKGETRADKNGFWFFATSTAPFRIGNHYARARQVDIGGKASEFSVSRAFRVSLLDSPKADFSGDDKVTITDWSIFLFRWGSDNRQLREKNDLDGNGKIDISDFSIFLKAMRLSLL